MGRVRVECNDSEKTTKACCAPQMPARERLDDLRSAPGIEDAPASSDGMAALEGGRFLMGTDYVEGFPADGEGPVRPVVLSAYAIDIAPVTNEEFVKFIETTGYVTEAERFGWSFVFWASIPAARYGELVADTVAAAPWWCQVPGAKWDAPEGLGSSVSDRLDHPVVHVTWNDAATYAAWCGKSLPSEAEWEFAARGGLEQKLYQWGDELMPDGEHRCNTWQGTFPSENLCEDGYAGTCPVRAFPPNGYGLVSMTGNVWEWTADWFGTEHAALEAHDPKGLESGTAKVMKGGSFLCHASYCNRYRVAARTQNTPDSSTSNIGFRCVRRG